MPRLHGVDPELETTPVEKRAAEVRGTALIRAMFGERFGLQPKFVGIPVGIQNYNGYVLDENTGERRAVLSFQRFGQGENPDPFHQLKILESVNKLRTGGLPAPEYLADDEGKLLLSVPKKVEIDGEVVSVPSALLMVSTATAQEFIDATPMPNPVTSTADAQAMGRLLGEYLRIGNEVFTDIGTMQSPISLKALSQLVVSGLNVIEPMPLDKVADALKDKTSGVSDGWERAVSRLRGLVNAEKRNLANLAPDNHMRASREASFALVQEFINEAESGWAGKTVEAYQQVQQIWEDKGYDALPQARLHGDFYGDNMFAPDEKYPFGVMFDFGWMGDGVRIMDIAQAIVLSCHAAGKFDESLAHALVQGVQERVKLTEPELDALPQMVDIMFLRSTATRFTSMIHAPSTQVISRSPLELQARREAYQRDVLSTGLNWARGEFRDTKPGVQASGTTEVGGANGRVV